MQDPAQKGDNTDHPLTNNLMQHYPAPMIPASSNVSKVEKLKEDLNNGGIHSDMWKYYLIPPQSWDYNLTTSLGLRHLQTNLAGERAN